MGLEDLQGDLVGALDETADLVVDVACGLLRVGGGPGERRPTNGCVASRPNTRVPSARLMPKRMTMSLAVAVTASRSSAALVVISPKTICSAARPARRDGHPVFELCPRRQGLVLGRQRDGVAERRPRGRIEML